MSGLSQTEWRLPPADLKLGEFDVHLWRAELDQPAACVASLRTILSDDERARADRFRFERDRDHYTVGRGTLRLLLGRYLEADPLSLRFVYSEFGKPALVQPHDPARIEFNLSHSHGLALLAFTRRRAVGVDLERIRTDLECEEIGERFFSPLERQTLRNLPPTLKAQGFFNCWTRKEAYIKARGEGLSFPLDQFDVSLAPGSPAVLLTVRGDEGESARWTLRAVAPDPGYAGAIAVEGRDWQLHTWRYSS